MKSFALVALLGVTSSFKLDSRFATGMNGDEDLDQNIIMKGDKYHYNESLVQSSAESGAGWVELPDCKTANRLELPQIALKEDLSNAIIATCKSFV